MRKPVVGVMGSGEATTSDLRDAYELGKRIAEQGWVLLTGGRNVGVMNAASQGAKQANGVTIGILPGADATSASDAIDIAICTGMGNARNVINVLSSTVVIACGMGAGTASEIALALKANKGVILLNSTSTSQAFFQTLSATLISIANSPEEAVSLAKTIINH